MAEKTYLGDGCYASFDGLGVELTTENGVATTNTIYIEPQVYGALRQYWEHVHAPAAQPSGAALETETGSADK